MPSVQASIEYLQKLPLYEDEKPYWCLFPPNKGFDPDAQRLDNLEFEEHEDIPITDIRDLSEEANIDECGFQVLAHSSKFSRFDRPSDIDEYRRETEDLLRKELNAEYVYCYDSRLRKNIPFMRAQLDLNDPLITEGPARGVHNDLTYDSGPVVIGRYLSESTIAQFTKPGYRFRVINTWRTLVPVLEDSPLALCDSRSVTPDDLMPADRIIPDRVGEVYYLTYNPNHKWFWLEKQTPSEPFAFVIYDTKAGSHARFCPHVAFVNPRSPENATRRESIETRSIVITKE